MKKLLLLPFVALLLAATYGPPFSVSDFSSLTNRPNPSAINPVGVVLGRTSAYDGAGGLFVFNPAATNAIDDDIYLGTTTTGRWVRISRLVLLADNPLTLTNGQLSSALLTNYFSFLAGTNMQVTVTSNTVTYAMTNTATGSGGTNWYAYVVNTSQLIEKFGLIGNDSSDSYGELRWNVAATTNLLGGTNIFASIVDHKITNIKLDYTPTNSLLGSDLSTAAGSFANVGPIYVGANLLLSESGGVNTLSAIVSSGTNSWQIGVDGVVVTTPNIADASNVSVTASGTNVTFNLTATGVSAGTYSNATFTVDDRGRLSSASSSDLYSTLTNILAGGTNVVLTYGANLITINSSATGSGGGGAGTNAFVNGVLVQPLRMTNSASVLIYTNGSGDITFNVNDYDGFYSDLTNALVAGSNISFVYTNNTIRISSTSGGGSTNGTVVTVDGGADLTRANFADTTGINVANSGTNVTVNIIDRDFGDLTTSSSGTVMTIDNSVITSNKLAAANVTQDKLSATGTATSTNFLAGDYTYKQVTTNMIPGLVNDITSLQKALSFTNGVTNINNVVSADLAAGSNISFSTNNGKITIASSGGGSFTISTNNLGFLSRSAAIVTNTETGGEVTHATFAIPANTLGVDGDEVEMHVAGQWLPYTSGGPNGYIYRLLYDDDSFAQLITGTLGTNIFPASSSTLSPDWLFRIKRVDSNTVFLSSVHSVGNQYNESNPTNLVNDTRVRYLDLQGSDTLDNATVTLSFTTEMVDGTRAATMKTYGYIMSKVGSGGGNGNAWDGSPIASGTVTNLTVETINGDEVWSVYNGDIWAEGDGYGSFSDVFYPGWYGFAIAAGLPISQIATTNNPSVTPLAASANSNSGYSYAAGTTSEDIGGGGKLFIAKGAFAETNLVVGRCGFQDSVTATEPVDGAYLRWANGYIYGVLRNNSAETVTTTSNLLAASSTTYYELRTLVNLDAASVTFWLRQATAPMVFTTVWSDSVTNTLPTGPSRLTGSGISVYRTTGSAGLGLFNLDALGKKNIRRPTR